MLLLLLFCGLIVVSSFYVVGWNRPPACLRAAPLALFGLGNLFQIKIARQEEDQ